MPLSWIFYTKPCCLLMTMVSFQFIPVTLFTHSFSQTLFQTGPVPWPPPAAGDISNSSGASPRLDSVGPFYFSTHRQCASRNPPFPNAACFRVLILHHISSWGTFLSVSFVSSVLSFENHSRVLHASPPSNS